MCVPQESSIIEGAKYSGGDPEWRVVRKPRQEATFATYCGKSEAINDAFKNNFLHPNLNVISQTVLHAEVLKIFLEINISIVVPSVGKAKSLGK